MSTFRWVILCVFLMLQTLLLSAIAGSMEEMRLILIEFYNMTHKTYHIKQIPQDRLPQESETEV